MSRTRAQIQQDQRAVEAAARRRELQAEQRRWATLESTFAVLERERAVVVEAYGSDYFSSGRGPFDEKTPRDAATLRSRSSRAQAFLDAQRIALRTETQTAQRAERIRRLPSVPTRSAEAKQEDTVGAASIARNLDRFRELTDRSSEHSESLARLIERFDKVKTLDEREKIASSVRAVVVEATNQARQIQRDRETTANVAALTDAFLSRQLARIAWCRTPSAHAVRAELQGNFRDHKTVADDLEQRVDAVLAAQAQDDLEQDRIELAESVAQAFEANDGFIVADGMVDLLKQGEDAYVGVSSAVGHGLLLKLDGDELRATTIVEAGRAVDLSFESKWCDELSVGIYAELRRNGWQVEPEASHQSIQQLAAGRLPVRRTADAATQAASAGRQHKQGQQRNERTADE